MDTPKTGNINAYTDGSFSSKNNQLGIGIVFLVEKNKQIACFAEHVTLQHYPEFSDNRESLHAEMIAVLSAINHAISMHYRHITIYCDNNSLFETHSSIKNTYYYHDTIEQYKQHIHISFSKIKSGKNHYNKQAHNLAKTNKPKQTTKSITIKELLQ